MNLDNPTVVPAPETTQPMISGDAFPPMMSVDPTETTQTTTTETTTTPAQKIVVGDRVFNTEAEAIAYADGFVQSQTRTAQKLTPTVETAPAVPQKKLGQLIFEDPDQAFEVQEQRILEKVNARQAKIDSERKFWDDLYSKNPDLRGSELVVDAVLVRGQNMNEFQGMTLDQLAPVLTAKARQEISKIRNVPSGGQALPSNPAVVAGSSGASTPRPQAVPPAKTDFISELRTMRKKG